MEKELVQFNKYISKDDKLTAEYALSSCCLDGRCKDKKGIDD